MNSIDGSSGWLLSLRYSLGVLGKMPSSSLVLHAFMWWITPKDRFVWELATLIRVPPKPESSIWSIGKGNLILPRSISLLIFVQEGQKLIDPLLKDPTAQARDQLGWWLADFFSYKTWRNGRASPIGWWKLYVCFCTFLPDVWMIVVVQLFLAC